MAAGIADRATLEEQYRGSANLTARANLHRRYGRGDWFPWLAKQVTWQVGWRVADIGCGPGWFWAEAGLHLPAKLSIDLVDASPGMVAEASGRLASLGRAPRGHVADAMALPFADESFDAVVAAHMLYHVADPVRALGEFRRVLKPEGVLLVALNGPRQLREIWQLNHAIAGGAAIEPGAAAFGIPQGAAALAQLFGAVDFRRYDDTLRVTEADDVVSYLASCNFEGQPGTDLLRRFDAEVRRVMAANGGIFSIEKDVGAFACRKTG